MMGFKWEKDDFWWERLLLQDIGLPESWNQYLPPMPDKIQHFFISFWLCYLVFLAIRPFHKRYTRHISAVVALILMNIGWEIIWDGMIRHPGASWIDMIFNSVGVLLCWLMLSNTKVGQTDGETL
jgi:VanZ family protein